MNTSGSHGVRILELLFIISKSSIVLLCNHFCLTTNLFFGKVKQPLNFTKYTLTLYAAWMLAFMQYIH